MPRDGLVRGVDLQVDRLGAAAYVCAGAHGHANVAVKAQQAVAGNQEYRVVFMGVFWHVRGC